MPANYEDVDFDEQAQKTLDDAIREILGERAQVKARAALGRPAVLLAAVSRHARLLVVDSRGRGAFTGMPLGSVSYRCLHHAHCPVVDFRGRDDD
ncbi:MAG: universal stress protein [Phycicoccus sp.]|nr:universal stress protein [Cellulomonas sp.]NMM24431.1 universal stress protein [Phycicoccus sp.]